MWNKTVSPVVCMLAAFASSPHFSAASIGCLIPAVEFVKGLVVPPDKSFIFLVHCGDAVNIARRLLLTDPRSFTELSTAAFTPL